MHFSRIKTYKYIANSFRIKVWNTPLKNHYKALMHNHLRCSMYILQYIGTHPHFTPFLPDMCNHTLFLPHFCPKNYVFYHTFFSR